MNKILLHPDLKKKISQEFGVTVQSVDMSLKGVFHSAKAKAIRLRAKELLKVEFEKVVLEEDGNEQV